MDIAFVTVDVFTDRQFGGNPLAVVPDGRGLTAAQMQAIASEFNLSETTFVLPPHDAAHTAHVRIFTPRANCRSPAIPMSAPLTCSPEMSAPTASGRGAASRAPVTADWAPDWL